MEVCKEQITEFKLIKARYREAIKRARNYLCSCLRERIERVIEVHAPILKSRWFGETEERLREVMDKFLRLRNAALIIYSIETLANTEDENLIGVRAELAHHLSRIEEANRHKRNLVVIATTSLDEKKKELLDASISAFF